MQVNEDHVDRIDGGVTSVVHMTNGTYLVVRDDIEDITVRIRDEKVAILARALSLHAPSTGVRALASVPDGAGRGGRSS